MLKRTDNVVITVKKWYNKEVEGYRKRWYLHYNKRTKNSYRKKAA